MGKRGKKHSKIMKDAPKKEEIFSLEEAIKKVKKLSYSSFVGSLDVHLSLNLPKDKDAKSLKGSISLPHVKTAKEINIVAFVEPEKKEEALKAGAIKAGLDDLIKEVKEGKVNIDIVIATPTVMPKIAVLGKILGPKGLMPNPKTGTVTEDVVTAIEEYKKGKMKFKCDETGNIHLSAGKLDQEDADLEENIRVAIKKISDVVGKPATLLIKSMYLAPTMGSSIKTKYAEKE